MRVTGAMQQPESPAPQPRRIRLHHCQGCCNRDSRIERVAAALQDFVSGARRERMGGGNRRVLVRGGRLRDRGLWPPEGERADEHRPTDTPARAGTHSVP